MLTKTQVETQKDIVEREILRLVELTNKEFKCKCCGKTNREIETSAWLTIYSDGEVMTVGREDFVSLFSNQIMDHFVETV